MMSYEEISNRLNLSVRQVKTIEASAIKKLRMSRKLKVLLKLVAEMNNKHEYNLNAYVHQH